MADEQTSTETTDAGTDESAAEKSAAEETVLTGAEDASAETTDETSKDGAADEDATEETAALEDFSFPEGMEIDQAMLDQFGPIATELGLDQVGAQKLVDLYASSVTQAAAGLQEQANAEQAEWVAQGKADKEFGGDKYDESVALANRAISAYGGESLVQAIVTTGFANHPEALKLFASLGRNVSEDGIVLGGSTAGDRRAADVLFDKTG